MAEIRNTLDLVMERTRHLHMTEEDRRKQAAEAFREAVGRLIRKYLEGQIGLSEFQKNFNQLEGDGASNKAGAAAQIGALIDPASTNTPLLLLLEEGLGFDISQIQTALHRFRQELDSEEVWAIERIRNDLIKEGISGNAVVPNLETDKHWAGRRAEMFVNFRAEIAALIARLSNVK